MDKLKRTFTQVRDPQQATNDKQNEIMQKQEQKSGEVTQPGKEGQRVRDPVTGEEMEIRDATEEPEEIKLGENVLKMEFPPPEIGSQREYLLSLLSTTVSRMTLAFTILPIITFSVSPPAFTSRPLLLLIPSLGIPAALSLLWMYRMQSKGEDDADRRAWEVERRRGLQAGYDKDKDGKIEADEKIKESAEWLNSLLGGHSVRISDLGLGKNPIRITSLRALPDAEMQEVTQSLKEEDREQIQGEHVNYELSFAYRAAPNKTQWSEKAENIHSTWVSKDLMLYQYVSLSLCWCAFTEEWVQLSGLRLLGWLEQLECALNSSRILPWLPKVSIAITPLHKKLLPNMMDIPFISRFISDAINAAAREYVAPKSMILDLQQLLSGDGIKR
ncbi:6307_t:CDS:2, partial [Acaulospora colombiana]